MSQREARGRRNMTSAELHYEEKWGRPMPKGNCDVTTCSTTFSDEYIELCRKLALSRKWQEGDWVYRLVDDKLFCLGNGDAEKMMLWPSAHLSASWLPREGDWLDLLEAEGVDVQISHHRARDGRDAFTWVRASGDVVTLSAPGRDLAGRWELSDPETLTALCRLYMAVTGV